MLRVVLAAVLASALLGTAFTAVDTASRSHGNARVAASAERLATAMADLRDRAAAVPAGSPGARRVVTVRLPARSRSTAGVEYLAVGGRPGSASDGGPALAWKVAGSGERTRRVPSIRVVGVGDRSPSGRLVVESPGEHRFALALETRDGRATVVVRRLASTRTPIRESATSGGHARTAQSVHGVRRGGGLPL